MCVCVCVHGCKIDSKAARVQRMWEPVRKQLGVRKAVAEAGCENT